MSHKQLSKQNILSIEKRINYESGHSVYIIRVKYILTFPSSILHVYYSVSSKDRSTGHKKGDMVLVTDVCNIMNSYTNIRMFL